LKNPLVRKISALDNPLLPDCGRRLWTALNIINQFNLLPN